MRLWRERFAAAGIAGLEDTPPAGTSGHLRRTHGCQAISITLGRPPRGETHWSSRAVAERAGVSKTTVLRIWQDHDLQPHRTRGFKFSTDPELKA